MNLHHTLKELAHSASKAVKDIPRYLYQQANTVAKTSVEKIGKPLATVVLGPAILMKETLDALTGNRKLHVEEEGSSWSPENSYDETQPEFPLEPSQEPSYGQNWEINNESDNTHLENSSPSQNDSDLDSKSTEIPPVLSTDDSNPSDSDLVFPSQNDNKSKRSETDIDIRFGTTSYD